MDNFKELYHLRWGQENAYRDIKYPLCLKALHSKKYEYVVQEIWARAILHNFCSEIALNVEIEQNGRKYEYQLNYSQAVNACRDFLRIHDDQSILDVEGLIAGNLNASVILLHFLILSVRSDTSSWEVKLSRFELI